MGKFDFLREIEIKEPEKKTVVRKQVEINGDFRVYRKGALEFHPEYKGNRDAFIDLFFSDKLAGFPEDKPRVLFFLSNDEKVKKADIKGEGNSTYLKDFYKELCENYELEEKDTSFLDFKLDDEVVLEIPKAFLIKVIARGERKGEVTYVPRNDVKLIPVECTNVQDVPTLKNDAEDVQRDSETGEDMIVPEENAF